MTLLFLLACNGGAAVKTTTHGDDSGSGGVASFSATQLTWSNLTPGFSENQTLDVTNTGTGALSVTEATIVNDPSSVFTTDFTAFTLNPGDIGSVVVAALLTEAGSAQGQLRVRTSDPAASEPLFDLIVN